jgi:hypothetical protein
MGIDLKEEEDRKVMARVSEVMYSAWAAWLILLCESLAWVTRCSTTIAIYTTIPRGAKWGLFGFWKDSEDEQFERVFPRLPELSVDCHMNL